MKRWFWEIGLPFGVAFLLVVAALAAAQLVAIGVDAVSLVRSGHAP